MESKAAQEGLKVNRALPFFAVMPLVLVGCEGTGQEASLDAVPVDEADNLAIANAAALRLDDACKACHRADKQP